MGFDIFEHTERVLEQGFTPPTALERSQTRAFARWIREPYGAVFFIRRWRNDEFDTDCVIAERTADGSWCVGGSGGGGWWDPFDRPARGWDGDPVVWGGETGTTLGDDEAIYVRVIEGMASPVVARLDVFDAAGVLFDQVDVRSDTPVVIVGTVGPGPFTVVARAAGGSIVRDAMGREVRDLFEPDEDEPFGIDRMFGGATEEPIMGAILRDSGGNWLVDAGTRGREIIDDPALLAHFERSFGRPREWPRRISKEDR